MADFISRCLRIALSRLKPYRHQPCNNFFISPITWGAKMLGTNSIILKLNPITYFLEVFRDPILGITPPASAWLIMLSMVVIGYSISLFLFSCFYHRIAFWVE